MIRINLTSETPKLEFVKLTPPLEGINGMYSDGLIYATVNECPSAAAGIYSIDPVTPDTRAVVNNYMGHHLNSPNDLAISPGAV
jgi:hypothetical protein